MLVFRLGKPVDFIQTILKSVVIKDGKHLTLFSLAFTYYFHTDVVRMCAIGRSASLAGWLTLDAFQWVHQIIQLLVLHRLRVILSFWLIFFHIKI